MLDLLFISFLTSTTTTLYIFRLANVTLSCLCFPLSISLNVLFISFSHIHYYSLYLSSCQCNCILFVFSSIYIIRCLLLSVSHSHYYSLSLSFWTACFSSVCSSCLNVQHSTPLDVLFCLLLLLNLLLSFICLSFHYKFVSLNVPMKCIIHQAIWP